MVYRSAGRCAAATRDESLVVFKAENGEPLLTAFVLIEVQHIVVDVLFKAGSEKSQAVRDRRIETLI